MPPRKPSNASRSKKGGWISQTGPPQVPESAVGTGTVRHTESATKTQEFQFVLVDKSSGGDGRKALREVRSHAMKRYREAQKRDRQASIKDTSSEDSTIPSVECELIPWIPAPTFALNADFFDHSSSSPPGLLQLRSHIRQFFSLGAVGQMMVPLLAKDPVLSLGIDWLWKSDFDSLRSAPPDALSVLIKTKVLGEVREQLSGNSTGDLASIRRTCLLIMTLIGGASIMDRGLDGEITMHIRGIHQVLSTQGGLSRINESEDVHLPRLIFSHVAGAKSGFSSAVVPVPPFKLIFSGVDLDDPTKPQSGISLETPFSKSDKSISTRTWLRMYPERTVSLLCDIQDFSRNIIATARRGKPARDVVTHQRDLQKRLMEYPLGGSQSSTDEDCSIVSASIRERVDQIYECCRLTSLVLVAMASYGISRREGSQSNISHPFIESLVESLHDVLYASDVVDLWAGADAMGLLFWIAQIATIASRGMHANSLFKPIQLRLWQYLVFLEREWQPVADVIDNWLEYQDVCDQGDWTGLLDEPGWQSSVAT